MSLPTNSVSGFRACTIITRCALRYATCAVRRLRAVQIPKHAALAVGALLIAQPAHALTLQPGTYKLEWKIPRWSETLVMVPRTGVLKPIPEQDIAKITGLKSAAPMWTTIDGRTLIVDESAGERTGYDIVYILPDYKPGQAADVSTSLQIRLFNQGSKSVSEESDAAAMDIGLGTGDKRITRRAGVGVQVAMRQDPDGGRVPSQAGIALFGGWFGKIPSDEGDVEIRLIDNTANGAFNDKLTLDPKTSDYTIQDIVAFGRGGEKPGTVALGSALRYEGKLYKVAICPTGETVEIQPYSGPTGTLRFETRDGKNNLVQSGESVTFFSAELGGIDLKSGDEASVLPGDYRPVASVTFGPRKKRGDPGFIATVKTNRIAKIEDGKTTTFVLGGPVSMSIDPNVQALEWTAGTQTRVKAMIFAGEDELSSLGLPEPKADLMIRDAAGRAIGKARQDIGLGNPRYFALKVFDYLKPGSYWLTADFQPGDYQPGDTVSANKPINLTAAP